VSWDRGPTEIATDDGSAEALWDPAMAELEARLAEKPPVTVPAITLDGTQDPLKPGGTADHQRCSRAGMSIVSLNAGTTFHGRLQRNSPTLL
jgi:hypothetical protein